MTTPNTTLTPTQLVEQATFQPANMPPEFNLTQDMVQASVALRLATELEVARKELVMLRKATIDLVAVQHLLRQQRTAIDAARKEQS